MSGLNQAFVSKGVKPVRADDQMIYDFNSEDFTRFVQVFGKVYICLAGQKRHKLLEQRQK